MASQTSPEPASREPGRRAIARRELPDGRGDRPDRAVPPAEPLPPAGAASNGDRKLPGVSGPTPAREAVRLDGRLGEVGAEVPGQSAASDGAALGLGSVGAGLAVAEAGVGAALPVPVPPASIPPASLPPASLPPASLPPSGDGMSEALDEELAAGSGIPPEVASFLAESAAAAGVSLSEALGDALGDGEARSGRRSRTSPDRVQRSFYLSRDLVDRARAAVSATMRRPGEAYNVSQLAGRALENEVLRLERDYNNGNRFPPVTHVPSGPSPEGVERIRTGVTTPRRRRST
jgi:hypothetical protein